MIFVVFGLGLGVGLGLRTRSKCSGAAAAIQGAKRTNCCRRVATKRSAVAKAKSKSRLNRRELAVAVER